MSYTAILACYKLCLYQIFFPPSSFGPCSIQAYANATLYPRGSLALVALDGTANDPGGGDNDWKSPDGVPALHLYKAINDDRYVCDSSTNSIRNGVKQKYFLVQ